MDGTSPLTFSPDRPVSRQEAAALLVAALRYSVEKQGAQIADSLTPYRVDDWLAGFKDRKLIGPDYARSRRHRLPGWACSTRLSRAGCSLRSV